MHENSMELMDKDAFWYALHVRQRFEKVVVRNLRAKGYEDFLPLYRRRSRWSDRVREIELPLFPGYVFCRFNAQHRLPILTIPGVHAIVGTGKIPTPVIKSELDSIQGVLNSGSFCEPWPFLEVGETVRIEEGPLTGLQGIVLKLKTGCRLVISVNLLRRSVAVEIDRDCLKRVSDRETPLAKNVVRSAVLVP